MNAHPVLAHRLIAIPTIATTAALSLPLTALVLDTRVDENLLLPIQLGAMTGVGAGVGAALPGLAGKSASHLRGGMVGAGLGVGLAIAADAALMLLIGD
jgi:hypothetical protein